MSTKTEKRALFKPAPANGARGLGPRLMGILIVCFGLVFSTIMILTLIYFSTGELRSIWTLTGSHGASIFALCVSITALLAVLLLVDVWARVRRGGRFGWGNVFGYVFCATTIIVLGNILYAFDGSLLDDEWYSDATLNEEWVTDRIVLSRVRTRDAMGCNAPGLECLEVELLNGDRHTVAIDPATLGEPTELLALKAFRGKHSGRETLRAFYYLEEPDPEYFWRQMKREQEQ